MDEDDDSAALAHQMELEQQEQEAIARGRRLLTENRRRVNEFEHECAAHRARVNELTRTFGVTEQ